MCRSYLSNFNCSRSRNSFTNTTREEEKEEEEEEGEEGRLSFLPPSTGTISGPVPVRVWNRTGTMSPTEVVRLSDIESMIS